MQEREPLLHDQAGRNDYEIMVERTTQLNNEVAQLNRLCEQLGSSRDGDSLRRQLRAKREECTSLCKSTTQILKRIHVHPQDKVKYERLINQLNAIVTRCQKLIQESIQKERVMPLLSSSGSRGSFPPIAQQQHQEDDRDEEERVFQSKLKKLEAESMEVDAAIIQERNREMQQLEKELISLNEVFVDVAHMIQEQGEDITTIEQQTSSAAAYTEEGTTEIRKANEYQKSARKKLCCIAVLVTVILLVVVIVFAVMFGGVGK